MSAVLTERHTDDQATGSLMPGSWVNVLSHLDSRYGGMSSAVPALASAVAAQGQHAVSIAGFCASDEQYSANPALAVHRILAGYPNWLLKPATRQHFAQLIKTAAGVHIHGLWEQSTLAAAHAARSAKKPFIISGHGMLQAWALKNKSWKKIIYGALIERPNLSGAFCLHALTQAEAGDYRSYGLKNPIAVIPNGVEIPAGVSPEPFLAQFPQLKNKRIVLFLSRIHFKKGLDILCQAWASAAQRWPDVQLVLAGPDFENTRALVEKSIATSGIQDRVTLTGMLKGDLKWSALSAAECFVLPSYSEGLSVSVLEAMGMGLPVIITKQCNLPEVAAHGCGWVIDPDAAQLESALNDCLGTPFSLLSEMGSKGRTMVSRHYSWSTVGEKMSELYTWAGGGPLPAHVEIQTGAKS